MKRVSTDNFFANGRVSPGCSITSSLVISSAPSVA
jgi:hypothetical protein